LSCGALLGTDGVLSATAGSFGFVFRAVPARGAGLEAAGAGTARPSAKYRMGAPGDAVDEGRGTAPRVARTAARDAAGARANAREKAVAGNDDGRKAAVEV
jgi:hypothetical protein